MKLGNPNLFNVMQLLSFPVGCFLSAQVRKKNLRTDVIALSSKVDGSTTKTPELLLEPWSWTFWLQVLRFYPEHIHPTTHTWNNKNQQKASRTGSNWTHQSRNWLFWTLEFLLVQKKSKSPKLLFCEIHRDAHKLFATWKLVQLLVEKSLQIFLPIKKWAEVGVFLWRGSAKTSQIWIDAHNWLKESPL